MSEKISYVFFGASGSNTSSGQQDPGNHVFQLFIQFLVERKVLIDSNVTEEIYEIYIDDDLPEELLDEIEEKYSELFAVNQQLMEETAVNSSAGVIVNLSDGSTTYADIPADILSRVMSVITPQEMGDVVNAIVDAVENPDPRTLCERVREDD